MHAVAATWTIDPTRAAEQERALRERLVPMAREAPGFFSGYWTYNVTTGKSYSFTILDSEDSARQLLEFMRRDGEHGQDCGGRLDDIGLAEVVATA